MLSLADSLLAVELKKPALRVYERMVGTMQDRHEKDQEGQSQEFEFELKQFLFIPDLEYFLERDPKHRALITGIVVCKHLCEEPMTSIGRLFCI